MRYEQFEALYYGVLAGTTLFALVALRKRIGIVRAVLLVGALFVPFAVVLFLVLTSF